MAAVQAVLGGAFSDMEVIRALHMANDDVTAAINILLDAPLQPSPPTPNPSPSPLRAADCAGNDGGGLRVSGDGARSSDSDEGVRAGVVEASEPGTSDGDWWLVGSCELAGLSTCKGRRVKAGDRVVFGFPAERSGEASSRGKVFGRGRAAASCSEIVRFSTVDCGEV